MPQMDYIIKTAMGFSCVLTCGDFLGVWEDEVLVVAPEESVVLEMVQGGKEALAVREEVQGGKVALAVREEVQGEKEALAVREEVQGGKVVLAVREEAQGGRAVLVVREGQVVGEEGEVSGSRHCICHRAVAIVIGRFDPTWKNPFCFMICGGEKSGSE